jgi:hypothetical protein
VLHSFFLCKRLQFSVDLCILVNGIVTENVALVVVDVHRQAVSFGFASHSTEENVMFIERIATRVLLADKTLGLVLLEYALHYAYLQT